LQVGSVNTTQPGLGGDGWEVGTSCNLIVIPGEADGSRFEAKCLTRDQALDILKKEVLEQGQKDGAGTGSSSSQEEQTSQPHAKKFKLGLFKKINDKLSTPGRSELSEIDDYLKMPPLQEEDSPLGFWKNYASRFPTLSALAKIYLPMPATSGGVERLFSVAGAVARARRASMVTETLEKVLCYRQHLKNCGLQNQCSQEIEAPDMVVITESQSRDSQPIHAVFDEEVENGSESD
jgi:hAT family C-terminal dimerisation region